MNTDKILDDARKEVQRICHSITQHGVNPTVAANQILALSDTTDIDCPGCHGLGNLDDLRKDDPEWPYKTVRLCTKCDNGVIKYEWEIRVVRKNGELPKCEGCGKELARHCFACQGEMFDDDIAEAMKKRQTKSRKGIIVFTDDPMYKAILERRDLEARKLDTGR